MKIFRRHKRDCPRRSNPRHHTRGCRCTFHIDVLIDGGRIRRSLRTGNEALAYKRAVEIEQYPEKAEAAPSKRIDAAVEHYLDHVKPDIARSTWIKRRTALLALVRYAGDHGIHHLGELTLEQLDGLRAYRALAPLTWRNELEILRHFYRFAVKRNWAAENVAADLERPKRPALVREREPFTTEELIAIQAAADQYGDSPYSRLRARALVLLLRHTALRLGDAVCLRRDAIQGDRLIVVTQKKGTIVNLPLVAELREALEALPLPIGAPANCEFLLWNGHNRATAIKVAGRMLTQIFRRAGVVAGHAHRYRHTLATKILSVGGTAEDVSSILGNGPAVVRKHYAKWADPRQDRADHLYLLTSSGTPAAHKPFSTVTPVDTTVSMVPVVGVEPTTLGL